MSQPRQVPWIDTNEWECVYHWLFGRHSSKRLASTPQDADMCRIRGIHRVEAWRSRGRVPPAVDSTATLVASLLNLDAPSWQQQTLRMELSMSFVRFVNGILDPVQKGTVAQSLGTLANQMQLPGWFVELRNSATHGKELPTLALLISGCRQALVWLDVHYWQPEMERGLEEVSKLRHHISSYQISQRATQQQILEKKFANKIVTEPEVNVDVRNLLRDTRNMTDAPTLVSKVLLEPGNMIPLDINDTQVNLKSLPGEMVTLWLPALKQCSLEWKMFYSTLFRQVCLELLEPKRESGWLSCWAKYLYSHFKEVEPILEEMLSTHPIPPLQAINPSLKVDLSMRKEVDCWKPLRDWTPVPIGHCKENLTLDESWNDVSIARQAGILVTGNDFEPVEHVEATETGDFVDDSESESSDVNIGLI